jgi:hypothetical protein
MYAMENKMNYKELDSKNVILMKSTDFISLVFEKPVKIFYRKNVLFFATIDSPENKNIVKKITYSKFSRYSKKEISAALKGKSAIEVVCGYGHDQERSFFIHK